MVHATATIQRQSLEQREEGWLAEKLIQSKVLFWGTFAEAEKNAPPGLGATGDVMHFVTPRSDIYVRRLSENQSLQMFTLQ